MSRKPGFSGSRLAATLATAGIEYVLEKELGNPVDSRAAVQNGDAAAGRNRMRAILTNGPSQALQRVVERATERRIALLCVEREHDLCHRAVIADMAVERDAAIEIVHVL